MWLYRVALAGGVALAYLGCLGRVDEGAAPAVGAAPDAGVNSETGGGARDDAAGEGGAGDLGGGDAGGGDAGNAAFDWTMRATLAVPRTELAAAVVDGKIYAMGGYSGSLLSRVDEYDPATNAWQQRADMHVARRSFAAGAIDGKIYVSSGMAFTDYNAVTWLTSTEAYDPATNTWTDRAPCPIATDGNAVWGNRFVGGGVMNGLLYVVAFDGFAATRNTMYVYDPSTDAWTTKVSGAIGVAQFGVATLDSQLYVFASPYFDPPPGQLWSWDPTGELWVFHGHLPPFRSAFLASSGKLYTLGGVLGLTSDDQKVTNAIYEYDPATTNWTPRGGLTGAREYSAAVDLNGHVFIVGGDNPDGAPSGLLEEGIPRTAP